MLWQPQPSVSVRPTSEEEICSGHPGSPDKMPAGLGVFCSQLPLHREGTGEAGYFPVPSDVTGVQNSEINIQSLYRGSLPVQLL